jgi:hypothetical protein
VSRKTFIVIAVIALAALISFFGYRQIQVDSCLDSGGKWNSEFSRCDGARSRETSNRVMARNNGVEIMGSDTIILTQLISIAFTHLEKQINRV